MFKLPLPPSPQAKACELADYLELKSWVLEKTSRQEAILAIGQGDDNLDIDGEGYEGCVDASDANEPLLDEALNESERRQIACCGGYPFQLDPTGTVLKFNPEIAATKSGLAYLYLLAATRLNMNKDRIQSDIDGTQAMETLSAQVLKEYLGPSRCRVDIFGTSSGGSFKDRIARLCTALAEPAIYSNIDGDDVEVKAQDDKLDVVTWIPFKDSSPGQLIVFAQAKTGTSWRDTVSQLSPDAFQQKWLSKHFLVPPVRAFCVAEAITSTNWNSTCAETGLLLDRCRLVECCNRIEDDLEARLLSWVGGAKETVSAYQTSDRRIH